MVPGGNYLLLPVSESSMDKFYEERQRVMFLSLT